ncbi:MAG: hypothetical protein QXZ09_05055 [Candidatus Methanomethylicaceae archaeon]
MPRPWRLKKGGGGGHRWLPSAEGDEGPRGRDGAGGARGDRRDIGAEAGGGRLFQASEEGAGGAPDPASGSGWGWGL